LEGRPWAEAAESGRIGQANHVNGHPATSGSDVISAAVDSTVVSDVRPTGTVNIAIIAAALDIWIQE